MQDAVAFHRLIAAAPEDDAPRLVYADWLEERGDPRGTFIRVQCALARLAEDHPSRRDLEHVEDQLFKTHGAAWAHGIAERVGGFAFRRGMIEEITIRADAFLKHAPHVLNLGTIRTVHVREAADHIDRLARSPYLARVWALGLCYNRLGDDAVRRLARSEHVRAVASLDLSVNRVTDVGVQALVEAGSWPNLLNLDLSDNARISDRGAVALARSTALSALVTLNVCDNRLGPAGVAALAGSRTLRRFADVRLSGNPIGDEGSRALARSPLLPRHLTHSRSLDLSRTNLGPSGIQALLAANRLKPVRVLRFDGNRVGDDGLTALSLANLPYLSELRLSANGVTDAGAAALAGAPLLGRLKLLDLSNNSISPGGAVTLRSSPYCNWRTVFELENNRPTMPDAASDSAWLGDPSDDDD